MGTRCGKTEGGWQTYVAKADYSNS